MKILRVCYEYPPPWDGLTPGPFELSLAQVEAGHEVLYFAGGRTSAPVVPARGIRVRRLGKSWPTFLFGPFFSFDILVAFHLRAVLKKEKFDVLHIHGNTALWVSILRRLGIFKGIPFVFHAHSAGLRNFRTFWGKAGVPMRIKALFIWTLLAVQDALTIRAADGIIAVSESDREFFIRGYGCPEDKITAIENGVNTTKFRRSERVREESLRLMTASILSPRKNLEKILSVMAVLVLRGAAPTLTIVGRGEKDYVARMKALAAGWGIADRIVWRGYVAYPDLPSIYADHDVFLLFSHLEGLPKVVLEAISSGLGVVSTRSFAVTGYLNDVVSWVDDGEDEQRIADKILRARDLSINEERFTAEYSWGRKAWDVERLYKEIIRRRSVQIARTKDAATK